MAYTRAYLQQQVGLGPRKKKNKRKGLGCPFKYHFV